MVARRSAMVILWRYGAAVLAVTAAVLLRWSLPGGLSGTPYLAFYPAVAAAALFGGAGPGLLATAASFLCVDLLFDPTPGWVDLGDPVVFERMAIFVAGGAGVSLIAGMQQASRARERCRAEELRESEEALRRAQEELENRVQERTGELRKTMDLVEAERRRFKDVLDRLPAYLVLLSPDYRVPFANRFFEERFGRSLGKRCYEYLFHRNAPCENCETFRVLKADAPYRWEWTGPDGRNYDIHDFPFTDVDGSPLIMEVGLDITEVKWAQAALREANETLERRVAERTAALRASFDRYRSFLDLTGQLGWTTDANGQVVEDLPAWRRFTGQTEEEIRGWGWSGALHPDDLNPTSEVWRAAVEARSHYETEYRLRRHDGVYRDFLARGVPSLNDDGSIREWVGTCIDITERKRSEESLRQSEQRERQRAAELQAIFDTAPIGLAIAEDAEARHIRGNPANERILGVPSGGELSKRVAPGRAAARFRVLRDGREMAAEELPMQRAVRGETVTGQTLEIAREDGRIVTLYSTAAPLFDEEGRPRGAVGAFLDITELVEAQEALRRTARELARSNQDLEQFAYIASHDLQEPLRTVGSYVQLLERRYKGRLDAEADEFIHFAVDAVTRMQTMIKDLLAYSRVGMRGAQLGTTEADQALDRALANLQVAIEESGASITREPLPRVKADAAQLTQLFQNLIGNAIKFRGSGPPRIHLGARPADEGWQVSVSDNGIGIDPRFSERIFEVFQRLHTRGQYAGTGIGLALCRKIVERHGGRIWVESKPGEGSTFHFTLPKGEQA